MGQMGHVGQGKNVKFFKIGDFFKRAFLFSG